VLRRTIPIALVVGTLLTSVNEGAALFGRHAGTMWFKVAANYIVPFCVSTLGYLAGKRAGS